MKYWLQLVELQSIDWIGKNAKATLTQSENGDVKDEEMDFIVEACDEEHDERGTWWLLEVATRKIDDDEKVDCLEC